MNLYSTRFDDSAVRLRSKLLVRLVFLSETVDEKLLRVDMARVQALLDDGTSDTVAVLADSEFKAIEGSLTSRPWLGQERRGGQVSARADAEADVRALLPFLRGGLPPVPLVFEGAHAVRAALEKQAKLGQGGLTSSRRPSQ